MKSIRCLRSAALLAALLIALFVSPLPVQAQEDEIQQLKKRVIELEDKITELEMRLQECTRQDPQESGDFGGWKNRKNWRKLEVGMPYNEVELILGEPVKIIQGFRTLWYYPNIYCGYVSFDEQGRLTGWSEP